MKIKQFSIGCCAGLLALMLSTPARATCFDLATHCYDGANHKITVLSEGTAGAGGAYCTPNSSTPTITNHNFYCFPQTGPKCNLTTTSDPSVLSASWSCGSNIGNLKLICYLKAVTSANMNPVRGQWTRINNATNTAGDTVTQTSSCVSK